VKTNAHGSYRKSKSNKDVFEADYCSEIKSYASIMAPLPNSFTNHNQRMKQKKNYQTAI